MGSLHFVNNEEGKKIEEEKVILAALEIAFADSAKTEYSLSELAQLVATAGGQIVDQFVQKRAKPDSAFYIGQGKVEEIKAKVLELEANTVIFDDELSASQHRNLEAKLECKVLDRTQLILDIFAQRAQTKEGKLQVELAQLKYSFARLTGKGLVLSRLGGGIGTRGPGETKLETDRRRIRKKISDLEKEIEEMRRHRKILRQGRKKSLLSVVALVGYTNAGKSTLLNKLTGADVLAENKLFATLDPTTRKVELAQGGQILLTDTVGFIQKLPHHLVAAFRATLEETQEADLLIHLLDASSPAVLEQAESVYSTLEYLKVKDKPTLTVFNKTDLIDNEYELARLQALFPDSLLISAEKGWGLKSLLETIDTRLNERQKEVTLVIPYSEQNILAKLHAHGWVLQEEYRNDFILVQAKLDYLWQEKMKNYLEKMEE